MTGKKQHTELLHLSDIEYRKALNRINANACYKRKQIQKLKDKLARLEGNIPAPEEKTPGIQEN